MQLLHHHIYRLKFTELNEIYFSMSLRTLAFSLIGIFVPIYLYTLGFLIQNILLFFVIYYAFMAPSEYFSGKLVAQYGAKHIISASYLFYIASFILLLSLPKFLYLLYPTAVIMAIASSLFWVAYHADFSKAKHTNHIGRELSKLYISLAAVSAFAPLLGGYIASRWGIQYVLGLVIFILILAIFPLFRTKEITKKRPLNFKNLSFKKIWKDLVSYAGLAVADMSNIVIWPFFIYLLTPDYKSTGFAITVGLVVSALVMLRVGKLVDHHKKHYLLKRGSFANAAISLLRILVKSYFHVLVVNILGGLAFTATRAPFVACYYIHADEEPRIEYIVVMEIATDILRLLVAIALLILSFFVALKVVLMVGLLFGALGSLLMGTMR